jgi:site-specific recombinase XerD
VKPRRIVLPSTEREEYLKAMQQRGYTAVTMGCKNRYVDEFLRFLKSQCRHTSPSRVTKAVVEKFRVFLQSQRVSADSKRAKWQEVSAWFRWLHAEAKIDKDPFCGQRFSIDRPSKASDRPGW